VLQVWGQLPRMNQYLRVALFGGIYSNHIALSQLLKELDSLSVEATFFLGDIGGFGPYPDRSCELLRQSNIFSIQGNYEHAVGHELADCGCGYTDPRDNKYAQLSYDYTLAKTSKDHREWMKHLPQEHRFSLGKLKVLLFHGSPRRQNEFLWKTATSRAILERFCTDRHADILCGTHTGLHYHRRLSENRHMINVGVVGRPANDGQSNVWYTIVSAKGDGVEVEFRPLHYDHERLAKEMEQESLPTEFAETVRTGWWTTCLEILPAKERAQGKY